MRLDLMPIRPPVIDAEAFDKLDELRRFRHVWPARIQAFQRFLDRLHVEP